jgi:hypothetical protein
MPASSPVGWLNRGSGPSGRRLSPDWRLHLADYWRAPALAETGCLMPRLPSGACFGQRPRCYQWQRTGQNFVRNLLHSVPSPYLWQVVFRLLLRLNYQYRLCILGSGSAPGRLGHAKPWHRRCLYWWEARVQLANPPACLYKYAIWDAQAKRAWTWGGENRVCPPPVRTAARLRRGYRYPMPGAAGWPCPCCHAQRAQPGRRQFSDLSGCSPIGPYDGP